MITHHLTIDHDGSFYTITVVGQTQHRYAEVTLRRSAASLPVAYDMAENVAHAIKLTDGSDDVPIYLSSDLVEVS